MTSLIELQNWFQKRVRTKKGGNLYVKTRAGFSGEEGLRIYAHAYEARLIECLGGQFPVAIHFIGQDIFDIFARDYLKFYPPNHYSLSHLGDRFLLYLQETRPRDIEDAWQDFFMDLVALEHAYFKMFDAAEDLGSLNLEFDYPVHLYFSAFKKGESPEMPQAKKTRLKVYRKELIVCFKEI